MPSALIIGASRGLGLGLVKEWQSRGFEVVATRRGPAPELEATGAELHLLDMGDTKAVAALAATLEPRRFDVVLINAGVKGPEGTVHDMPHHVHGNDSWSGLFWTNALAPVRAARHLEPLVAAGGVLAFMTSIMGSVALRTYAFGDLYSASKAALNSLTRGFAAEHPTRTIINLHPGWVKTDMGGQQAPVEIPDSCRGMADVLARAAGTPGQFYLDYEGKTLPW
ncbi:SDR family NAD(P)-dependent oxidoreductase [Sandarakinorhabdus rubra]|uniref:SDR family NAD(P)-dependent oxidoreductase n=1 Tax=Sandarakinorhabdus rubra TaxID=2672568 RepID=UPI0013DD287E|nr:SDR family NAD(P)-dependent oxidoreductase [Sandarakinorhabdus rubra]